MENRVHNGKFINEVENESTANEEMRGNIVDDNPKRDQILDILITSGLDREKALLFNDYLTNNEYDSDAICYDIEDEDDINGLNNYLQ